MKRFSFFLTAIASFLIIACGGDGGGSAGSGSGGTGSLALSLQDAPTDDYRAVYVTIKEVQVHMGGNEKDDYNWDVVASPNKTYNLKDLTNGVREELGISSMLPGEYTQMRLIVGQVPDDGINILSKKHPYANYVIEKLTDIDHELKVPSGFQTGVKLVKGFTITEKETTELIIDFDAARSVVRAGNSGKWLLKPTIKVIDTDEYAIVKGNLSPTGTVSDYSVVSAQSYDPNALDEKNEVMVQASTFPDSVGKYSLFIEPGTYNILYYRDGYSPTCKQRTLLPGKVYEINETLSAAAKGTFEVDVKFIDNTDSEKYATISARKESFGCTDENNQTKNATVELKSFNIGDEGSYETDLPTGVGYRIVASSYNEVTQGSPLTVSSTLSSLTFSFP
jgi:Domain of unknown function (DUF4382)